MGNCTGQPKTCCSCHEQPESRDACMCGCGYLNGAGPILGAQMLTLCGLFFSLAALGDCSFVELDQRLFLPERPNLPIDVTQTQYIGLLTWQRLDGTCYWYNEGDNPDQQVQDYYDFLGSDWQTARVFGGMAASLSFYFFCYLLSFICSSQVRGVRYFDVFFALVVLTTLQGMTFFVFSSSICDDHGCTFSRAAGFSVAAMACFVIAGMSMILTKDYPGDRFEAAKAAPVTTYNQPAPVLPPPPVQPNEESVPPTEEPYYDEEEIVEEEVVDAHDDDGDEEEIVEEEIVDESESGDPSGSPNTEKTDEEQGLASSLSPQNVSNAASNSDGHEVTLDEPGQTYGVNPGAS